MLYDFSSTEIFLLLFWYLKNLNTCYYEVFWTPSSNSSKLFLRIRPLSIWLGTSFFTLQKTVVKEWAVCSCLFLETCACEFIYWIVGALSTLHILYAPWGIVKRQFWIHRLFVITTCVFNIWVLRVVISCESQSDLDSY